jgi:N-acetylglucosamine-6-phosphate deacetylase
LAALKEAVEEALPMASVNPAKLLKLDDRLGRLMPDTEPIWSC